MNKKKTIYLSILVLGIILIIGTFAWLTWKSNETTLVLTVGEIDDVQVTLKPYKIDKEIISVLTYENEAYINVDAINRGTNNKKIKLYYHVNSINQELINSDFKYTILKSIDDGNTYTEYLSGDFSSSSNDSDLYIMEEYMEANKNYKYKVYIWLDGTNSGQGNIQGMSFNGELRAEILDGYKLVTFNGNIFNITEQSNNGLTLTYDYENSYLTLNGTMTSVSVRLNYLTGLTFKSGDQYRITLDYISGEYTSTNSKSLTLISEFYRYNSSGFVTQLSTRLYKASYFPNSDTFSDIITVTDVAESEAVGLTNYLYSSTYADTTFTNYKVKVNITKVETKEVMNGSAYGSMSTPTRLGFTFDGWYTGENGTGTKITSDSVVSLTSDQTLYAKWIR